MSRTPKQKGKLSRRKGASYERQTATTLQQVYPQARRGIGQARSAGEVADVEGTPWWVECKHKRKVSIRAAFEQGTEAQDGRTPRPVLVVSRENNTEDLVTMSLTSFLLLVKENESLRAQLMEAILDGGTK